MKKDRVKPHRSGPRPKSFESSELDSREVLVLAAIKLFAEKGYDGTTTRDIVQTSGLNISLISYYFGGKEGLLEACLEFIQGKIQDESSLILDSTLDPLEYEAKLRQFIASFLGSHVQNPHMHRVVQREFERDSAIFKKMVDKHYVKWYQKLTSFIAYGQTKHWVQGSLDPMTMAIGIYGALVQQVRLDRFRREIQGLSLNDPNFFAKTVDDLATFFARGLFHL